MKTLHDKLVHIQQTLEAPKNQYNSFGGYHYRSCEDILGAVKPLLDGCTLTIDDEVVQLGARFYVRSTVTLTDGEKSILKTAYAREPEAKKGMDESQITGATSSYARKYALNAMFAIDDTKDADTMDNRETKKPDPTDSWKVEAKTEKEALPVCAEHGVEYRRFEKDGKAWYAHKTEQGWCNYKSEKTQ